YGYDSAADDLSFEDLQSAAVEQSSQGCGVVRRDRSSCAVLATGKEAKRQRSPNAAEPVYGHRTDGVINAEPFQEIDAHDDQNSGDPAEQDRTCRTYPIAGASNSNQPSQKSVRGVAGVPFLKFQVPIEDRGKASRAGSQGCICGHATDAYKVHRRERAAGVEPIPAEPENK